MSDLISRSKLLKELKSLKIVLNGKQIFSDDAKDTVLRIVNEQPTAYDIDKVVEELGNYGNEECCYYEGTPYKSVIIECVGKAIEIVKQGGVSDDVCEPSAYKIKVTSLEVIVTGSKRKPYYEIKYKEVGADHYNIGYSSYNLDFVLDWKEKCFELVKVV